MKNLKRFLGIIASVAVIGLVMTACGTEESVEAVGGSVSISNGPGGPFVNYDLIAEYSGSDAVWYFWFKAPAPGDTINFDVDKGYINDTVPANKGKRLNQDRTASTYKPTEAGFYWVAVTGVPVGDDPDNATLIPTWSSQKEVTVAGNTDPPSFYGRWDSQQFTPAKGDGGKDEPARSEKIFINYEYFYLESTFAGHPAQADYRPSANDDMEAPFEYAKYKITNWTKLNAPFTVPTTTPPTDPLTNYSNGYRLTVTTIGFKGYAAYSAFEIYSKSSGQTVVIRRSTNNAAAVLNREYEQYNTTLPNIDGNRPRSN